MMYVVSYTIYVDTIMYICIGQNTQHTTQQHTPTPPPATNALTLMPTRSPWNVTKDCCYYSLPLLLLHASIIRRRPTLYRRPLPFAIDDNKRQRRRCCFGELLRFKSIVMTEQAAELMITVMAKITMIVASVSIITAASATSWSCRQQFLVSHHDEMPSSLSYQHVVPLYSSLFPRQHLPRPAMKPLRRQQQRQVAYQSRRKRGIQHGHLVKLLSHYYL